MMRPPLSRAATHLLRQLLERADLPRDKVLVREFRSTDWHSLTYEGERHEISLRIPQPDAETAAYRLTVGLADAEFILPGHVVADIALASEPAREADGSIAIEIEALTLADA